MSLLHASIFKCVVFEGCSNHGISHYHDMVTIVNCSGPITEPVEDMPATMLIRGPGGNGHVICVPAERIGNKWVEKTAGSRMHGGAFVYGMDSRFSDVVHALGGTRGTAVQLHDRFEP